MPVNNDLDDSIPRAPFLFGAVTALVVLLHLVFVVFAARDVQRTSGENQLVQSARVALAAGDWNDPELRFEGPFGLVFNQILIGDRWAPETKVEISDEMLFRARLGLVLFSLLSVLGAAYWARTLFGDRAGALAALAFGLHPIVVSSSALVHVDGAHAALTLFTAWCTARFVTNGRWSDLLCVGIALGLAAGTNALALTLAPFVAVLVLVGAGVNNREQAGFAVPGAAVLLVVSTVVTLHAVYLFRSGFAFEFQPQSALLASAYELPGLSHCAAILPENFLAGVDRSILVLREHRETQSVSGAANWLWQTPPGVLFVGACGLLAWCFGRKRFSVQARWAGAVLFALTVFPLLLLTWSMGFHVGLRDVLQFVPLVAVGVAALGLFLDRWTARFVCVLLALSCLPLLLGWK